ncbi:hypothetical protein [Pedobacter sp. MW01-1-1]|uniref:hypothetical protein n=1 Tax=Pedobacter sp. MW01-1-1 TaxID=3383027 RepID=UPI003FF0C63A
MKKIHLLICTLLFALPKVKAQELPAYSNSNTYVSVTSNHSTKVNTIISVNSDDNISQNGVGERVKTFSKSFAVDKNDKLAINNQFGAINIKTWDNKEVKVTAEIKAYSNSDSDAQKLLDGVNIVANKVGDMVNVSTDITNNTRNRGGNSGRREVKTVYTIYMPISNPLNVVQEYGNVVMSDFYGPTSFKIEYGNLTAGTLHNANNYISVEYGKTHIQEINGGVVRHEYGGGVTIGSAGIIQVNAEYVPVNINTIRKSANIKIEYGGGLTIGYIGENLLLSAEYASVNINTVKGNTVINQSYNGLTIGNVGKLTLKTEYTTVNLGTLNGDATINMSYNALKVGEISTACRNFTFNGEYTSVNMGFNQNYHANFNVSTSYSGFKYGTNVSLLNSSKADENRKFNGKIGSGGSANVSLTTEYGSITFK